MAIRSCPHLRNDTRRGQRACPTNEACQGEEHAQWPRLQRKAQEEEEREQPYDRALSGREQDIRNEQLGKQRHCRTPARFWIALGPRDVCLPGMGGP